MTKIVNVPIITYDYNTHEQVKQILEAEVDYIYYDVEGKPYEIAIYFTNKYGHREYAYKRVADLGEDFDMSCLEDPVTKSFGEMGNNQRSGVRTKGFITNNPIVSHAIRPFSSGNRCAYFSPKSYEEELTIGMFLSAKDKERNQRVWMKPGRAFRRMFPELTDAQLEKIVDEYREQFTPAKLELVVSQEPDAFKYAYATGHAKYQNPTTTDSRKSLANSCMRYEFDNLACHPAEAYASGEFTILYTKDDKGLVASRCVVWTKPDVWVAAPIYGVSEQSINMIQRYLEDHGAELFEYNESSWTGAKWKAIKHEDGGYIAPYMDCKPRTLQLSSCGDYLVAARYGDIDASDYGGVLGGYQYTCESCGDGIHEDDTWYSEHGDGPYCECCFREQFFLCHVDDCWYHNDYAVEVFYKSGTGYTSYLVHDSNLDQYIYVEGRGEYWHMDYVQTNVEDDDPEWYFVTHLEIQDYTYVEAEECYYRNDRVPTEEPEQDEAA